MENQNKNQLKSLKLLYVEDDEKTREILEELLLRITDNLIVRTNGEEGLEAYKEHMPDIVISDIRMPVMNGLEMVKKIKEINKNAAIVFISAYKDPALVVKVVELDVKRFLFKPVRLKELKEILFSIAKDINAQREIVQKEIEIEQEKKLTEKILNTQNSIVLLTTKNDEIVKANNRFFEFFPFDSLNDFKKKHGCICKFFIKEDGLIKNHQDIQKIAEAGDKNQKNRAKIYDKNKNIVVFSIAAEKIILDSKEHFVITLNDITIEEIAIEKAKDLDKIKSEFFTNMSHEIRTPLNGIIGFADLLEENLKQNELKNYASIISSSAKNLLSIINDILDYSKIEENKLKIENINADIPREIESVVELFYVSALEKNIDILLKMDPLFPDCIVSDPVRIRQVLSNLISNSIKFTPEDGKIVVELKYLCDIESECGQLYISVSDSGIGIAKDQQKKIFEAFSQADTTTTREFGGTGLGLTISSKLVSLLGGELKLESELKKGSKFYFTINISECEIGASRLPAFKPQKEKIAIYADFNKEFSQRELLKDYLALLGFSTTCFDYKSDFSFYDNERFDILFIFNNPAKDITKLKNISKKTIFIFKIIDDFDFGDCDDVVYYPIYGSKIYKAIKKALSGLKNTSVLAREKEAKYNSKVLIVEDNEVNQKLVAIILAGFGLDVKTASNGLEALSMFKMEKFDLIFMDINMPLMDGIEATKEILLVEKEKNIPHTPIIALTANMKKEEKDRFLSIGMDDYLQKPISKKTVETILLKYIKIEIQEDERDIKEFLSDETLDFNGALKGLGVTTQTMFELIKDFLSRFNEIKDELEKSIKVSDFKTFAKVVHKLKGVSGNLRMKKIHNLCKQMENFLDDKVFLNELLQKIYNEIELIKKRLQ